MSPLEFMQRLAALGPSGRPFPAERKACCLKILFPAMTSYEYLRLTLDRCLEAEAIVSQPMPLLSQAGMLERKRA